MQLCNELRAQHIRTVAPAALPPAPMTAQEGQAKDAHVPPSSASGCRARQHAIPMRARKGTYATEGGHKTSDQAPCMVLYLDAVSIEHSKHDNLL
jgi:hypothetical protein